MNFNDDTPSLDALVTREKRNHTKNKNKEQCQEARHARIQRKARLEEDLDDDWRDFIDR